MSDAQRKHLKAQALQQAKQGICDPLYRTAINQMLEQQREDPTDTSLVIINSFDYELEDIRDEMTEKRIAAEVFEIDRLQPELRTEYLNCLHEMYSTKKLPMIFMKDVYVGDYNGFKNHLAQRS